MASLASPLIGRGIELKRLDRALAALDDGSPAAVVFEGEPGIGKTRLLAELCERAEARDQLVLNGQAAEFERDVPFSVVTEAFDPYLASHKDSVLEGWGQELLDELAGVFPSLAPLAREPAAGLGVERYRAHRAMRALLERLAAERPLVIALDDLHWADGASVELIAAMLRRPPEAPVLLALAFRPGQAPARLEAALAVPGVRRLPIGPMSEAEAGALLGEHVDEDRLAELYRDSGGNPFYLEQLARSGGRPGRAVPTHPALDVPPPVAAALAEELEGLGPGARQLVEAAAVAGDPFEPDLAAEIAELSLDDGLLALDQLTTLGIVRSTQTPRRFVFRHPIVRRAVYERVGHGWRLAAHTRAAAALQRRGASAAERAAHVEQSAVPGDQAAIALLIEAGQATARRAPAVAARWFEAALELVPEEDGEQRIEVLWQLAHALRSVGELERCRELMLEAIERLPTGDPRAVELLAACAEIEHWLGRHVDARRRLTRAWDELPDRGAPEAAMLALELSLDGLYHLDWQRARAFGQRALEIARAHDDRPLLGQAAAALALGGACEGRFAEALEHRTIAIEVIDSLADSELERHLEVFYYLAWAENFLERWDASLRHSERGLAISRATGQGRLAVPLLLSKNFPLQVQGRSAEAVEYCEQAAEAARVSGNPQYRFWALWELAWALYLVGDSEAGIRAAEQSAKVRPSAGNLFPSAGEPGFTLGMLLVQAGEVERGREALLAGIGGPPAENVVPSERCLAWEHLAAAAIANGRLDEAREAADRAVELSTRLGHGLSIAWAKRTLASVILAEGGDPGEAAESALASAEAARTVGAHLEAAASLRIAGEALGKAGERERAIELLREAEQALDAFGAKGERALARRQLRALGVRAEPRGRAPADADGLDALSARERELAELVTDRKTNREIAAELFLSEKTVESHLRNIFAKLSVSSRVEVARVLERARAKETA